MLCHSAQRMLQKHSFCGSGCAVRRSCQRESGEKKNLSLNNFPLTPSALDVSGKSWAGA